MTGWGTAGCRTMLAQSVEPSEESLPPQLLFRTQAAGRSCNLCTLAPPRPRPWLGLAHIGAGPARSQQQAPFPLVSVAARARKRAGAGGGGNRGASAAGVAAASSTLRSSGSQPGSHASHAPGPAGRLPAGLGGTAAGLPEHPGEHQCRHPLAWSHVSLTRGSRDWQLCVRQRGARGHGLGFLVLFPCAARTRVPVSWLDSPLDLI